jgi:3-oxoadipate enol-lactonase
MPYAATDLGRLFVQSTGRGMPVTFWNCLFGDSSVYQDLVQGGVDGIAADHRVLMVEGPSHGRSDPWPRSFTLEQCADAWVQTLDASGVEEPAVFCGLSWGAMVALRVAIRHPERVRALVLMSSIATAPRPRFVPQFLALAMAVRLFGFPDWLIRQMASGMVSPSTLRDRPSLVHDMLSRNRHLDRRALHHAAASVLAHRSNIVDQLWRIHVPTWVVVGEHDRTTPVRAAKTVARAIENADLRVLDGVGHLLTLEAPNEARRVLREALGTLATTQRDSSVRA